MYLGYTFKAMDSLQDIMGKKSFTPPDEMAAIKDYVKRKYKSTCRVKISHDVLLVHVPSSALAATLQLDRHNLTKACGVTKKLVIRTGR